MLLLPLKVQDFEIMDSEASCIWGIFCLKHHFCFTIWNILWDSENAFTKLGSKSRPFMANSSPEEGNKWNWNNSPQIKKKKDKHYQSLIKCYMLPCWRGGEQETRRMGKGRILTRGDFLFIDIIHFKAGSLMMRASPKVILNIKNSRDVIFLFVCF